MITAEQLFVQAIERVESASIKAWAQTEHNRPIFIKLAQLNVDKNSQNPEVSVPMFAAYIVSSAIGL